MNPVVRPSPALAEETQVAIQPKLTLVNEKYSASQMEALRSLAFPEISYKEFKALPYTAQKSLIAKNRIINTDTYNRTMNELSSRLLDTKAGEASKAQDYQRNDQATFALQLRRSPFDYLVACGIEDMVEELTLLPVTQAELDFAIEHYREHSNVPFFNQKMWQDVIDKNEGKLPFEIRGVRDGTIVIPGEPMLTVKGPEELVAHFEHVFHRVFYSTLVATRAHALSEIVGDSARFVEVGKRGAITEEQHLQALKAIYVGGGFTLTSNDAGSVILPLKDTGTIGHRYIQRFSTEEASFRHAIEILDAVTLLVDLVDTYKGIDLSLELKEEYRSSGKKIWVRLDSGDILDQTRYFLAETIKRGMTDPLLDRVVVEGIESLGDIQKIENMIVEEFGPDHLQRVVYGAGGLIISDKTSRSDASSGFKISVYTDENGVLQPTMKFSDSPGKISQPGDPKLVILNGKRVIAQEQEKLSGAVLELFEPLYMNGKTFCGGIDGAQRARENLVRQSALMGLSERNAMEIKALRAQPSASTRQKIFEIHSKYGLVA